MKIVEEMKYLASTGYTVSSDFNPALSETATPYALMLRKIGPHLEFESYLNKSFDACVEALSDTEGWNDHNGVRFFGKVLAILPGLQRDAQIALACQFYFLNPDFKPKASTGYDSDDDDHQEQDAKVGAEKANGTPAPKVSDAGREVKMQETTQAVKTMSLHSAPQQLDTAAPEANGTPVQEANTSEEDSDRAGPQIVGDLDPGTWSSASSVTLFDSLGAWFVARTDIAISVHVPAGLEGLPSCPNCTRRNVSKLIGALSARCIHNFKLLFNTY